MTDAKRISPRLTFLVLALAAASFSLLQSLISPVLPTIQHELHTSQSTVTWVLTAWLLSASIATPLMGKVGDMIGKERTLVFAIGAVIVGSLVCALSPNISVMIAGRIIQGIGGAVFPLSFGIIRDEFPAERVPSAIGSLSAIIAVGSGLGLILAGPIVNALGWRWLFWLPLIVVLITGVLAHFFVPKSRERSGGRINWTSAILLSGWLVALLLPMSQAHVWGWQSSAVLGLFAVAIVLFASWIGYELQSKNPVIDMRMMRLPGVWTTNLVALLFGAGMFSIFGFLPQFAQMPESSGYGFGASVTQSGLLMLPMVVTMAIAGVLSGPIAALISFKAQLAGGSALSAIACALFAGWHGEAWQVSAAAGLFGLGLGMAYASMASLIVQSVPSSQTGVASGMNANIRNIGGAIGTAVLSSVITSNVQASGLPFEAGYTEAFVVLTVIGVVAAGVALLVPAARRVRVSATEELGVATPVSAKIG